MSSLIDADMIVPRARTRYQQSRYPRRALPGVAYRRRAGGFRRRPPRIMRSLYRNDELFLKADVYLDVKTFTRTLDSNTYAMWEVLLCPGGGATISTEWLLCVNDAPELVR